MNFNILAFWAAMWFFVVGHVLVGAIVLILLCAGAFE